MTDVPSKRIVKRVAAPTRDPAPTTDNGEAPAPAKRAVKKAVAPTRPTAPPASGDEELRSGWSAAQETIDSTSTWAVTFKPATTAVIIKILQPSPYASYRRHWLNRVGVGQRPYVCLASPGLDRPCPLCDHLGDRPSAVSSFNIAVVGDDGEAVVKSWDCGVLVTRTLKTFAADPKISPLNKPGLYFAVSKPETPGGRQSGPVQTMIHPVRERDLQDDWNTPPLTEAQLARLMTKLYDNSIIELPKFGDLEDIANELTNEDTGAEPGSGWN